MAVPDLTANASGLREPRRSSLGWHGPAVVAVSVGKDLGDAVVRYADAQGASEAIHLHVSVDDRPDHALTVQDICDPGQWTVDQLAALNARGIDKHLLILGPVSLAVRIGAAANGTGRTFVPFWDGGSGYQEGIAIGGSAAP